MKVVLFCGGLGMRLREHAENIPKPLVNVGQRPVLWHVMKYYAHWGHKDFILCLGWKGEAIKNYFLHYNECLSNDFVISPGGKVNLMNSDIHDWRITLVDTGANSNIGERLQAVRQHLGDDEVFLANYTDGLSDLPLPRIINAFHERHATATFVAVRPHQSWHTVDIGGDGVVRDIQPVNESGTWINGGFFVLNRRIFDFMQPGEDLVQEPFLRLIERQELYAHKYEGFWSCMDTYKDKQQLEDMVARGQTPWEVWNHPEPQSTVAELEDGEMLPITLPARPR